MDYKRFDDTILVRMDRGEEILEQVKAVALKEHVTLAKEVLRERFQGQL